MTSELETLREENAHLRQQLAETQKLADLRREIVIELKALVDKQHNVIRFYEGDFSVLPMKDSQKQNRTAEPK